MKRKFSTAKLSRLIKSNGRGFSLVTVASLGAVTMMWLMAISASVLPMYTRASQARFTTVVRSAAEASLDYCVNELKSSIDPSNGSITSMLDDGALHTIPADVLSADTTVAGQMLAKVRVMNIAPPTTSSIYQKQYDKDPTGTFPNHSSGVTTNGWRVVAAAADYAGQTRGIRVILEPNYGAQINIPSFTNQPYFQFGMFGQSWVSFTGNSSIDAFDSKKGAYNATTNRDAVQGDIGSNAYPRPPAGTPTIRLGPNTQVYGDLVSFSGGGSSDHTQYDAGGSGIVHDQLRVNGTATLPPSNVLGQDTVNTPPGTAYSAYPLAANQNSTMAVPVAQTAPPTSQVVAATMTTTGSTIRVVPPSANQVVNMGTVSVTGNTVMHIQPGDYQVSSLTIAGNGSLVIDPPAPGNTFTNVRLFVQGNAAGSNAIQIAGNGIVNNYSPPNLQLWYGGSKGTQIAGNGNFQGVIYAPNSAITVNGNASIYGALVGYTVSAVGNGNVHFDLALKNKATELGLSVPVSASIPYAPLAGLRTISWQELSVDQLRQLGLYPLR
jgi:hypothetical protein